MAYRQVLVYDADGDFIGYSIKRDEALKLQTTNLYTDQEVSQLNEQLVRLNDGASIQRAWPDARDADVVALLNNPNFMPIEMGEIEVVDDDHSYIVWKKTPARDDQGHLIEGQFVDSETIDEEASVLAYKTVLAPVRPSDVVERTRQACEVVARNRAGRA